MSIRARLTIAIAIVVLVIVAVLGTVVVQTTRATLVGQLDEQVLAFADRSTSWGKGDGGPPDGQSGANIASYPQPDAGYAGGPDY